MSVIGTTVQSYNEFQESVVTVTGIVTGTNTSTPFASRAAVGGSYVVSGTWATSVSFTVQLQGSNDGTNFVSLGSQLAASSGTTAQAGTISPNDFVFKFYRFTFTGGDAGTALSIYALLVGLQH